VDPRVDPLPGSSYHTGKMRSATRITSKGQVVIPKSVRDRMRWKPGTRLSVETTDEGAVVLRQGGDEDVYALIDGLAGSLAEVGEAALRGLEADHRREVLGDGQGRRGRR
jgi:AbrB family looped-hinge helix DNA binding protein